MIKLMLNLHKFNNYAFFCPVSRLHLTVSSPVGCSNEVTPAILKALKAETILDVDGVIDIETGTVKAVKQAAPAKEVNKPVQEKASEPKNAEPKKEEINNKPEEQSANAVEEVNTDDAKADDKTKKGIKKTAKTDAE